MHQFRSMPTVQMSSLYKFIPVDSIKIHMLLKLYYGLVLSVDKASQTSDMDQAIPPC